MMADNQKRRSPGRPPLPEDERSTKQFCMRLSNEDKDLFSEFAKKKRCSVAKLVRDAGYYFIQHGKDKEHGQPVAQYQAQFQMLLTEEDFQVFSRFALEKGWSIAGFLCLAVHLYIKETES